ncbi:MAG: hypothetical protein SFY95_02690 [Planctomycetota bacterium]|nr:hypothetical protein [Planctomycetota bacterium]
MSPIDLAGLLAERGLTQLILIEPGRPARTLAARVTDLPALLRDAPAGAELRDPAGNTLARRDHSGWALVSDGVSGTGD